MGSTVEDEIEERKALVGNSRYFGGSVGGFQLPRFAEAIHVASVQRLRLLDVSRLNRPLSAKELAGR
jgi:hypothetical protein